MKRFVLVSIILSAAISLAGVSVAQAETETDTQIEKIKTNCFTARNSIQQLHTSDAVLRVNIGQQYESMSTKLMGRFNKRVASNGLQNTSLLQATQDYTEALDSFRLAYRFYEERLADATKVDCNTDPIKFYEAIVEARTERKKVHDTVVEMGKALDGYSIVIDRFEIDFKAVGGAL